MYKFNSFLFATFISAVATDQALAQPVEQFPWPHHARAAISLAYDDAINSQLDVALPQLDSHGFKASFYLRLDSPTLHARLDEWRQAAQNGHELGNHTIFHPCRKSLPDRDWVVAYHDLDHYTQAQAVEEIQLSNQLLHAIDGQEERTFTLPCGESLTLDGDYLPAIGQLFAGIKVVGGEPVLSMQNIDMRRTPVWAPVEPTLQQLIEFAEQARDAGTMANYTFHGVGGDYLQTSAEVHNAFLAYLAQHQQDYWVATFLDISHWVNQQQATKAEKP